jgi:hypothetical protein
MYTFNRNKECTSLSQFMATGQKIIEEDDHDTNLEEMSLGDMARKSTNSQQQQQRQPLKLNEDFMFDMENQRKQQSELSIF